MGGLDAQEVAKKIGFPIDVWVAQCYGIACTLLKCEVVEGEPRYGHWTGPVSKDCIVESWRGSRMFVRHGWVEQEDGTIVDPTRWVFEAVEPYIYVGENDHYDAGGNEWRAATMPPCPDYSPSFDRSRIAIWKFCPRAHRYVMDEIFDGAAGITDEMEFWLANLPLPYLREHAVPIFRAIVDCGHRGNIPIDNYRLVLGQDA